MGGLGVDDLLLEVLPVRVGAALLDDDLLVVVRELVDDILEALAQLELVEGGGAFGVDGCAVGYWVLDS